AQDDAHGNKSRAGEVLAIACATVKSENVKKADSFAKKNGRRAMRPPPNNATSRFGRPSGFRARPNPRLQWH
ncbi:hypothetical protein, partial [Stenotrophomonas maltophilia]|uniref:hypothetical protein n=1 Tax=Stenotrophomonas maltophilia TaxID=40324 RepID=UPI001952CD69